MFDIKKHSIGLSLDVISGPYPEHFIDTKQSLLRMVLPGFGKRNLLIERNGNKLQITGSSKDSVNMTGEIAAIDCTFYISDNTEITSVDMTNGILTIKFEHFKSTIIKKIYDIWENGIVPKIEEIQTPSIISNDSSLVWNDSSDSIILHSSEKNIPTVEVKIKDKITNIAEVNILEIKENIDVTSTEPQIVLELKDATKEISHDFFQIEVIKTPESKPDILVSIDQDEKELLQENNVDITEDLMEIVKELDFPDVVVKEPSRTYNYELNDLLNLEIPSIVPQVVEMSIENDTIKLKDITTDVNVESELFPIVTSEKMNDMYISVPNKVREELENKVDRIIEEIEDIIQDEKLEVEVIHDPNVVILNDDTNSIPTVKVIVPEIIPSIVEIEILKINEDVSKLNEEPQVVLEIKDATFEVESDSVVTSLLKTEEGNPDVVIAADISDFNALKSIDVNIIEMASKAIEEKEERLIEKEIFEFSTKEIKLTEDIKMDLPEKMPLISEVIFNEETNKIEIVDAALNIEEKTSLIPIVTPDLQNDIVLSIPLHTKDSIDMKADEIANLITEVLNKESIETENSIHPIVDNTETFNEDNKDLPTVKISIPDEISSIMEAKVTINEHVENISTEPKVEIQLKNSMHEISDNSILEVVKTSKDKVDVIIAMNMEDQDVLEEMKVDLLPMIEEVIMTNEEKVWESGINEVESDTIEEQVEELSIMIPNEIPSIVELVKLEENKLELRDVVSDIPSEESVDIIPIITAKDENDIVLVIKESTAKELVKTPEELAKIVEELLQKNETKVSN